MVDYARAAGWSLYDKKCYVPALDYTEECDGILAIATMADLAAWLRAQSCPVVRLLCSDMELPFPAVEPDSVGIGARGAEHFLSLGSPNCVFYTGWLTRETEAIWRGFSTTLAAAGKGARLVDFKAGCAGKETVTFSRQQRWDWLVEQLRVLPRPLAVFAEDDRFANDLIVAAAQLGWRIPEDMAVLGADNRALILGKYPVPVSSVDTNLHGIGWAGGALLERILDGEKIPAVACSIAPGPVVARRSTATFVCDHSGVTAAVNYLRAHFHEHLDLAALVQAAAVSTRSLQSAFKEHLGHSVSDELSRVRLEHARRLLRETDLKLESVAHESGFGNAKYLCQVFRAAFGETPTGYRDGARAKG